MIPPCPRCGKNDFKKTRNRDAHINRKFPCKPSNTQNLIVAPGCKASPTSQTPLQQNSATDQILIQTHVPVGDLIQLDNILSLPIQSLDNVSSNLPQNYTEWFDNMEDKYNTNTDEKWPEIGGSLFYDYPKRNIINIEGNFGGKPIRQNYKLTNKELIFEECESSFAPDPLRPHQNLTAMSLWQAIIPSPENIKYRFNCYVKNPNKYLEVPYMPQLIANAREQITRVLKVELRKKDQIKTALVAQCIYHGHISKGKDKSKISTYMIGYHRSLMRVILTEEDINEHINLSISEIDNKIDSFMKSGSGWNLVRIEMLTIEAYTYQRAFGGSYISTPKKLANTKCTINPDNSQTGDDMCLKYALGAYFASNRGETKNLQRLSVL